MVRLSLLTVAIATVVSAQNIAISGVPTTPASNGAVPLRRELRDLQANYPDQFNLFLLGLQDFQAADELNQASYYQISGIHGMPYKPWNGVASTSDWQRTSGFGGYCTHSSILFAPWHRPYIALWEQYLHNSVTKVASQFPEGELRDKYVAAAKEFRSPYWDWAITPPNGSPAFPTAFSSRTIPVVDVDGTSKEIANPLFRFAFHPVNPSPGDFSLSWSRYNSTVRHPNPSTLESRNERIAPILANELSALQSTVGLLLLSYQNFDAFTSSEWNPDTAPGEFGSLEDVHNAIHDQTGGGGHMSSLSTSSFDPLFWMHHVNVDRLWAIWQDLNPDSFMSPRPAPYSTFSTNQGTIEDRNSPLVPFWDASGTKFWTSDEVRESTTLFGYAYPETQRWQFAGNTSAYQAAIRSTVSDLYSMNVFAKVAAESSSSSSSIQSRSTGTTGTGRRAAAKGLTRTRTKRANDEENADSPIPPPLQYLAPNNTYTEYTFNVRAAKHGLGQSFRILAFLGAYNSADPSSWDLEHNLVGRVSVLTSNMTSSLSSTTVPTISDNNYANEVMISGTIPLTSALLQDILDADTDLLEDLTPDKVVPYLREKLDWRAALFTGEEQDLAAIPGLEVSVASTSVTLGTDGVPVYSGEWTVWGEVTEGRDGGVKGGGV